MTATGATEQVLLQITGDAAGALDAIDSLKSAWSNMGQALGRANNTLDTSNTQITRGMSDIRRNSSGAIDGLLGIQRAIVGIGAAVGLGRLIGQLKTLWHQGIAAAEQMQNLRMSLETLAAKELVTAGRFENVSDALAEATPRAAELLERIRELSIVSPFEYGQVAETFRLSMAFGATSDAAVRLTKAVLDTGSGLSLTSAMMSRMNYNLMQALVAGDLTAANMRQLRMVGLDLAGILQDELGMSLEEVRAALESGGLTMRDVSEAFVEYAETNFGGAAERMSKTAQGLRSSFADLAFFIRADLIGPALEKVTAQLALLFDKLRVIADSGVLKRVGEFFATPVGMALIGSVGALVSGVGLLGGALAAVATIGPAVSSAVGALGSALSAIAPALPVIAAVIGAIGAALGVLAGALGTVYGAWVQDWGGIRTAVQQAWATIMPMLQQMGALVRAWADVLGGKLRDLGQTFWSFLRVNLEPVFARMAQLIGAIPWGDMFSTLSDALNVLGNYISAWLDTLTRLLRGEGLRAFSSLESAAIDGLTLVALVFDRYIKNALVWGWNLIVQFANGMLRAAQTVLARVMTAIGNAIGRFIRPGSPPEAGPLSEIIQWGQGLINTFLRAFGLADFGILRQALAPIKSILQSALEAGDIDAQGFYDAFTTARTQVAELIANFRETGQISEPILENIAATLGAGSEEYIRFLRLQLEHQRALQQLSDVQSEYAAAEAAGFVPADLKERLRMAQAEAQAAEDQVTWQSEYLAMQQESVDLQMELVKALERLADALEEATGGGGGGGGLADALGDVGGGGGGLAVPDMEQIPDIGELAGGAGGEALQIDLGAMSPEFEEMRGKIQGLVADFRAWLALPLNEKLTTLFDWLQQITGIDFEGYWNRIVEIGTIVSGVLGTIASTILSNLATAITFVSDVWQTFNGAITAVSDFVSNTLAPWLESLAQTVLTGVQTAITLVTNVWETVFLPAIQTVWGFISGSLIPLFVALVNVLSAVVGKAVEALTGIWQKVLLPALQTVWRFITASLSPIFRTLAAVALAAVRVATETLARIWTNTLRPALESVSLFIKTALTWAFNALVKLIENTVGPAITWFKKNVLDPLIGAFNSIRDAIQKVVDWLNELADKINNIELPWWMTPGSPTPLETGLVGIAQAARAVGDEFKALSDDLFGQQIRSVLSSQLSGLDGALGGSAGTVQTFGDLVFPGVSSGRDALSVRDALDRNSLRASMSGRVWRGV